MSNRRVVIAVLTIMIGAWGLASDVASQEAAQATDDYAPPLTPWGDPDLQGIWGAGYIFTPLERPDVYEAMRRRRRCSSVRHQRSVSERGPVVGIR